MIQTSFNSIYKSFIHYLGSESVCWTIYSFRYLLASVCLLRCCCDDWVCSVITLEKNFGDNCKSVCFLVKYRSHPTPIKNTVECKRRQWECRGRAFECREINLSKWWSPQKTKKMVSSQNKKNWLYHIIRF